MDFNGFYVSCFSGDNAWVVEDEVAADSNSTSIGVIFFRAFSTNNSWVGYSTAWWYLVFVNEKDGVGAFDSSSHALC